MRYHVVDADSLTDEQMRLWADWQQADPALQSPYFAPQFVQLVAAVRPRCEVAVMQLEGETVGFLPYHRGRRNVAGPVAHTLTDYQGAVTRPGTTWNAVDLLRDCRLSALYFDHMLADQTPLVPYHWRTVPSPYMDVRGGLDGYLARRVDDTSGSIKQMQRKSRKLGRDVGPVRLQADCRDDDAFAAAIQWKRDQYHRTATRDVFEQRWAVELLERLYAMRQGSLAGSLVALYAGDRLVAVQMGMSCRRVLHWWFPSYSHEFARYSPGANLLLRLAQDADKLGIDRIDLGKGSESYKQWFMTGADEIAEGAVDRRPIARPLRRMWTHARDYVRSSRLQTPARLVARKLPMWLQHGQAQ